MQRVLVSAIVALATASSVPQPAVVADQKQELAVQTNSPPPPPPAPPFPKIDLTAEMFKFNDAGKGDYCMATQLYGALMQVSHDGAFNVDGRKAIIIILFGASLLLSVALATVGYKAELTSLVLASGVVIFFSCLMLITPLFLWTLSPGACSYPIWASAIITLTVILFGACCAKACKLTNFFFLEGFTLGTLGAMVIMMVITHSSSLLLLVDPRFLIICMFITLASALIFAIISTCVRVSVGLPLRAIVGGFGTALSLSALMAPTGGPALGKVGFYLIFLGTALVGAGLQNFLSQRDAAKKAPGKKTGEIYTERSHLVKP